MTTKVKVINTGHIPVTVSHVGGVDKSTVETTTPLEVGAEIELTIWEGRSIRVDEVTPIYEPKTAA